MSLLQPSNGEPLLRTFPPSDSLDPCRGEGEDLQRAGEVPVTRLPEKPIKSKVMRRARREERDIMVPSIGRFVHFLDLQIAHLTL